LVLSPAAPSSATTAVADESATVVELTQSGCQFIEPEGGDHGYTPSRSADCIDINTRTSKKRLAAASVLRLKPGSYIFRVTNRDVPYNLGFYIRSSSEVLVPFKPSVMGGGIKTGTSRDYAVKLEEGEYVFSCPLNPTPNYRLIVKP
jgi:hypothetical protein